MSALLARIIDAHGGLARWNTYRRVDASIVTSGGFFPLKGVPREGRPRRMTVWLREERSSVFPYGAPDQRALFTLERIAIEKLDGTVVAERASPNGEALWTYLTTPFLLAAKGVHVEETEPWREGAETWRVLRAHFPDSIEAHPIFQDFFFDADLMLRRHDYSTTLARGLGVTQLTESHVEADGIVLPTRCRTYTRGPDRQPILDMVMASIDVSDVRFASED